MREMPGQRDLFALGVRGIVLLNLFVATIAVVDRPKGAAHTCATLASRYRRRNDIPVVLDELDEGSLVADACERLLEAAETSGGDIICGDHVGKEVCVGSAAEFAQSGQPVELWRYLKRLLLEGNYAHSPLFRLVRSGFTRENGISFAEGIIFEEHTWVMRLLLHGASVLRVDFPYYIHSVGDHPSL